MKPMNEATVVFLSRSANEGFARTTAACFAAQLDPTLEEVDEALPDWIEARNLARNLISPDGEPDWTAPESVKDYAASPAAVQRLIDLTDYGFYVHTVEDGTNVFNPWP